MFEYMVQGIARAGGVEVPEGKTVLQPPAVRTPRTGFTKRLLDSLVLRNFGLLPNWKTEKERSGVPMKAIYE